MIEPLRFSFEVALPPERTFDLWTRRIAAWWPRGHTVSGEPGLVVVLEPHAGGRIFERTPSGVEHDWGQVTRWEPPTRLGYLWHLRRDRADATRVEIRFWPRDEARTRVEIEHSGWDRLGAGGEEWRERNRGGWAGLLPHFTAAAEAS